MPRDIAVIVGSLRRGSLNRLTASALARLAPDSLKLEIVEIGRLPLYDEDLDEEPPQVWTDFRDRIRRADGVLFVTPEYNRSVPAPLKNAIDVGSRPYGSSAWNGKPAAVATVSQGALGGVAANHNVRQSLVFLNMPTLQQPEAYLGGAGAYFSDDGELQNEGTEKFLKLFIDAYAAWVETILGAPAA